MDLGLSGQLAVVTGASRGIGRAVAESLAREGCRLHLVARKHSELEEARKDLERSATVVSIQAQDMSAPDAAGAVFEACPDADVLINNAGGIVRGGLLDVDERRWREAWEPKVFGYVNLMRHYLRRMQSRRSGVIINIIGLGAEKVDYEYVAGSAGNAALAALTRAVGSASMDEGVRVLGVHPGWVETERTMGLLRRMAEAQFADAARWPDILKSWHVEKLIKPAEVADVVAFLASARASAMCGVTVNIDCGTGARTYARTGIV